MKFNRTSKWVVSILSITTILVALGQACGQPKILNSSKIKREKPLPPSSSLINVQPTNGPKILCDVKASAKPAPFRRVSSIPAEETFSPLNNPESQETITVDCSATSSDAYPNPFVMTYFLEVKHGKTFSIIAPLTVPNPGQAPVFTYKLPPGTHQAMIRVTDPDNRASFRGFLIPVKCGTEVAPLQLDPSKIDITPEELSEGPVQFGISGDQYTYSAEGVVLSGGAGKYVYSWDFNGDGIFDPYRDGDYYKPIADMPFEDSVLSGMTASDEDGDPFNKEFSYFRGQCETNASGQCLTQTFTDSSGITRTIKKLKFERKVGLRVLDLECNMAAETFKVIDKFGDGLNTTNPLEHHYGAPTLTTVQYLSADWENIVGPLNAQVINDPRTHLNHFLGIIPLKEILTPEDRMKFYYMRGIDITKRPAQLTRLKVEAYSKYGELHTREIGLQGMELSIIVQDLYTTSTSLHFSGDKFCNFQGVYNPVSPDIVEPCLEKQYLRVYGTSEVETEGTFKKEPITYIPDGSCTFDFNLGHESSSTGFCDFESQNASPGPSPSASPSPSPTPPPPPPVAELALSGTQVSPKNVTISKTGVVHFKNTNSDDFAFAKLRIDRLDPVTSKATTFIDRDIAQGEDFAVIFPNPGVYKYTWELAQGSIVVIDPIPDPNFNIRVSDGYISCTRMVSEQLINGKPSYLKFDGRFYLKMGKGKKAYCDEPGPGAGFDGPPPEPPPKL
ncbi:MAG: hypothetical protein IT289_08095 [Oligoflexia bacterium]|nr:hypothetical protein [Oligoflexia bacterium]